MWNLSDIMQAAPGGQALMNLAQQFGLSQSETQSAVHALLPAFSLALLPHTHTPSHFDSMLGLLLPGRVVRAPKLRGTRLVSQAAIDPCGTFRTSCRRPRADRP